MAWDYAELSKAAKKAGGPEKLLNLIEQHAKAIGRSEGKTSMVPWVGIAALGGSLFTAGVIKVVNEFKKKKAISQAAVDQAKAKLVQGIREYDEAHQNDVEEGNLEEIGSTEDDEEEDGGTEDEC